MLDAEAIELIRAAGTDASSWKRLCDALARTFGAVGAVFAPEDPLKQGPWLVFSEALRPAFQSYWRDGWGKADPRTRLFRLADTYTVLSDHDLGPAADLLRTQFYADLKRVGLGGVIVMTFRIRGERWFLVINKHATAGLATPSELELAAVYREHIKQSIQVSQREADSRLLAFKTTFDDMGRALLAVDVRGVVVDQNYVASIFQGRAFEIADGRLRLLDPSADELLQQKIERSRLLEMNDSDDRLVFASRKIGTERYNLELVPLPHSLRHFHLLYAAIVSITKVDSTNVAVELSLRALGLTPAETRLALGLAAGQTLKEVAAATGVTEGTARQQLKSVFRKTSSGRQAELVDLMRKLSAEN